MSKLHLLLLKLLAFVWLQTRHSLGLHDSKVVILQRIGSPGWPRRWPTPRRCRTCLSEWSGTDSMKKITTTKTEITQFTVFTSSQKAKKDEWAEHWKKNDHSFNNEESYFPSLTEIDFLRSKLNFLVLSSQGTLIRMGLHASSISSADAAAEVKSTLTWLTSLSFLNRYQLHSKMLYKV